MGRQKKNMQSKGMEDSPLKELNEMEVRKLSDTEFKIMVIKMLTELTDNYRELSEKYISMKKEIETRNKNKEEMNNKTSEIKNTLEGITSRLDEAEDQISELEDKVEKNTQKDKEKEKRLRENEEVVRELQNNMKCNNIHIIGIPEGEEEHEIENLFEKVMMENFPNLMREKVTQIQKTQRVPNNRKTKRPTTRHIIIKMVKFQDKERILKAAKENRK